MSTVWAEVLLFIAVIAQVFCLIASTTSASDGSWSRWVRLAAPTSTQKDFGSSLIPGVRVLAMKHPHSTETAPENPTDPSLGAPVPRVPEPGTLLDTVLCFDLTVAWVR